MEAATIEEALLEEIRALFEEIRERGVIEQLVRRDELNVAGTRGRSSRMR